jgi:hypothetical protein
MIEFVGGPRAPGAAQAEHLEILRTLVVHSRGHAPEEMLAPASRYLDLVEAVLQAGTR